MRSRCSSLQWTNVADVTICRCGKSGLSVMTGPSGVYDGRSSESSSKSHGEALQTRSTVYRCRKNGMENRREKTNRGIRLSVGIEHWR